MKITIPKAVVLSALNNALGSMKVLLHTLGKKQGASWYKNISHLRLPTGEKRPIEIPELTYSLGRFRKLKLYLNLMKSATLQATVVGNRIRVDIRFESRGEEIKVKCIRRVLGKWRECSLHMERAIHLNNALLSISFVPVAYKGSITCVDPKVTFKTDLEIDSQLCQAFDGLCGAIEKTLETKLTPKVVSATLAAFNDRRLKKHVANAMMKVPGLRDHLDGRKVLEVESKGSRFVLTVEDQQRARTQLAQRARAQLAQRARTQLAQRARTQLAQRARTQLAQRARTQLTQRARAQLAQRAQRSDRRR